MTLPLPTLYAQLYVLFPVIGAQVVQRLLHVAQNRFLAQIGPEALLAHSVQYTFAVFGQFVGLAAATCALIFWNRVEARGRQASLGRKVLTLAVLPSCGAALVCLVSLDSILHHSGIGPALLPAARLYGALGLLNAVLTAIYVALDGLLLASQQQRFSLALALMQLGLNVVADALAVRMFATTQNLSLALITVGASTSVLLVMSSAWAWYQVQQRAPGSGDMLWAEVVKVWRGEIGVYLVRGTVPFVLAYQFAQLHEEAGFLVTHTLAAHLAYLACLPVAAGCQIAVRDASTAAGQKAPWWLLLGYTAILPTIVLLLLAAALPRTALSLLYQYEAPAGHVKFLPVFFLACLVGQFGNVLSVPLRAAKRSLRVSWHFALSEYGILVGGIAALLMVGRGTALEVGMLTLAFSSTFLLLNVQAQLDLSDRQGVICQG